MKRLSPPFFGPTVSQRLGAGVTGTSPISSAARAVARILTGIHMPTRQTRSCATGAQTIRIASRAARGWNYNASLSKTTHPLFDLDQYLHAKSAYYRRAFEMA